MQQLKGQKTISDVSQTEYIPQEETQEQDSSDSYESSSGSSSSGSGSDSSQDEIKVVTAPQD